MMMMLGVFLMVSRITQWADTNCHCRLSPEYMWTTWHHLRSWCPWQTYPTLGCGCWCVDFPRTYHYDRAREDIWSWIKGGETRRNWRFYACCWRKKHQNNRQWSPNDTALVLLRDHDVVVVAAGVWIEPLCRKTRHNPSHMIRS